MKKGVEAAADYESSILDLKSAYQETGAAGSRSADQQKKDFKELTALATKLGSDLMGSTQDYVEILTSMKKAGIDVETVLGGAGEAAAHLANVNKTIGTSLAPEGAKELGQYGKMFDLKRDDYKTAVNLFSALKDRFDVGSGELIEGSKYFASTAKTAMDLRGYEGAAEVAKLIAFSKRFTGYEGSRSGTNLDAIITQFVQHPEAVKALEQRSGIKLDFFDAKGKFKGDTAEQRVETLFREMEKLRALAPKERLEALNSIFGVEGGRIAGQMVEQGVEGWRSITAEANKAVPVNEKIIAQMATYNAKTEALAGSWQNFKATAFTPLMEDAKQFIDLGSKGVNALQKFAAEHPNVARVATEFLAIGSAVLVVYSGVRMLTAGVKMYRLASAFARSEGLIAHLTTARTSLVAASGEVDKLSKKTKGLRGDLTGLGGIIKIILLMETIGFTWDQIKELQRVSNEAKKMDEDRKVVGQQMAHLYGMTPQSERNPKAEAESVLRLVQEGNRSLEKSLGSVPSSWTDWAATIGKYFSGRDTRFGPIYEERLKKDSPLLVHWEPLMQKYKGEDQAIRDRGEISPYVSGKSIFSSAAERVQRTILGANYFQQRAPSLADPQVMSSFRKDVVPTLNLNQEMQSHLDDMLKLAFPESFNQSLAGITEQGKALSESLSSLQQPITGTAELFSGLPPAMEPVGQSFSELPRPIDQTRTSLVDLYVSANRVPGAFDNINVSVTNVSGSLDSLSAKIANWQPPPSRSAATPISSSLFPFVKPPGYAVGGDVTRSGLAFIHADERIVPARARAYRETVNERTIESLLSFRNIESNRYQFPSPSIGTFYQTRPAAEKGTDGRMGLATVPPNITYPQIDLPVAASREPIFDGATATPLASLFQRRVDGGADRQDGINRLNLATVTARLRNEVIDAELLTALERPAARDAVSGAHSAAPPVYITYSPQVTIHGANEKAKQDFAAMLQQHKRDLARLVAAEVKNGRKRA